MKKIVVLHSSLYGHTKVIAEKISEGASTLNNVTDIIDVTTITKENISSLEQYDAMIFGSPTYMGCVSADFKKFMDLTSDVWFTQKWKDKFAAGFTNSASLSGDKLNTLQTIMTFACQHSMIWISQGIFPNGTLNRLGSWIGLMAQSDNASAELTPPESDRQYAFEFGKRIANFLNSHAK